jgi:hypothetical protein
MSRGPHPDDARLFSQERLPALRRAAEEVSWLRGRGYSLETAIAAAGNHHQLELRQRVALSRSCSSDDASALRLHRRCPAAQAAGRPLHVDGFNLVIALEVALAGGVLIRGREGALRDLAGLRGTYRVIDETAAALSLVGVVLSEHPPSSMRCLLDQRVSNSGRLKALLEKTASDWPFTVTVELVPDPDPILAQRDWVVTADAMILDCCGPWVNLASEVIRAHVPQAWLVEFWKGAAMAATP